MAIWLLKTIENRCYEANKKNLDSAKESREEFHSHSKKSVIAELLSFSINLSALLNIRTKDCSAWKECFSPTRLYIGP